MILRAWVIKENNGLYAALEYQNGYTGQLIMSRFRDVLNEVLTAKNTKIYDGVVFDALKQQDPEILEIWA